MGCWALCCITRCVAAIALKAPSFSSSNCDVMNSYLVCSQLLYFPDLPEEGLLLTLFCLGFLDYDSAWGPILSSPPIFAIFDQNLRKTKKKDRFCPLCRFWQKTDFRHILGILAQGPKSPPPRQKRVPKIFSNIKKRQKYPKFGFLAKF